MINKAAIILSGGKAERFQREGKKWDDKALATLFNKPLLAHVIKRASSKVNEIWVVVNEERRKHIYSDVLKRYSINNVKFCVDKKLPGGGPTVAVITGLKHARAPYCITLPCDVPFVKPAVLDYLLEELTRSHVAIPAWPNGRVEPLMVAYRRKEMVYIVEAFCTLGRGRLDDLIRGAPTATFVSILGNVKELDSCFEGFININYKEDLVKLPVPAAGDGPLKATLRLRLGCPVKSEIRDLRQASISYCKNEVRDALATFSALSHSFEKRGLHFWAGLAHEYEGKSLLNLGLDTLKAREERKNAFSRAAQSYGLEAKLYEEKYVYFLAGHVRADELWCWREAGNKEMVEKTLKHVERIRRVLGFAGAY